MHAKYCNKNNCEFINSLSNSRKKLYILDIQSGICILIDRLNQQRFIKNGIRRQPKYVNNSNRDTLGLLPRPTLSLAKREIFAEIAKTRRVWLYCFSYNQISPAHVPHRCAENVVSPVLKVKTSTPGRSPRSKTSLFFHWSGKVSKGQTVRFHLNNITSHILT